MSDLNYIGKNELEQMRQQHKLENYDKLAAEHERLAGIILQIHCAFNRDYTYVDAQTTLNMVQRELETLRNERDAAYSQVAELEKTIKLRSFLAKSRKELLGIVTGLITTKSYGDTEALAKTIAELTNKLNETQETLATVSSECDRLKRQANNWEKLLEEYEARLEQHGDYRHVVVLHEPNPKVADEKKESE